METKRVAFEQLHPMTNLVYFLAVILVFAIAMNPILQGIAYLSAFLYLCDIRGKEGAKGGLTVCLAALFPIIINPLFSHEGMTILFYFKNGNPLTLESIYFGMGMGLLLIAMLVWFQIVNATMTTDKWVQLFGIGLPAFGLLLAMVFRLVPRLDRQRRMIKQCNPLESPYTRLSMLVTWGLEHSVDTADSMAARGYGSRKRSRFLIYPVRWQDRIFLCLTLLLAGVVAGVIISGRMCFYYYPLLLLKTEGILGVMGYAAYGLLCLLPVLFNGKESLKWRYLQSKI